MDVLANIKATLAAIGADISVLERRLWQVRRRILKDVEPLFMVEAMEVKDPATGMISWPVAAIIPTQCELIGLGFDVNAGAFTVSVGRNDALIQAVQSTQEQRYIAMPAPIAFNSDDALTFNTDKTFGVRGPISVFAWFRRL